MCGTCNIYKKKERKERKKERKKRKHRIIIKIEIKLLSNCNFNRIQAFENISLIRKAALFV